MMSKACGDQRVSHCVVWNRDSISCRLTVITNALVALESESSAQRSFTSIGTVASVPLQGWNWTSVAPEGLGGNDAVEVADS